MTVSSTAYIRGFIDQSKTSTNSEEEENHNEKNQPQLSIPGRIIEIPGPLGMVFWQYIPPQKIDLE